MHTANNSHTQCTQNPFESVIFVCINVTLITMLFTLWEKYKNKKADGIGHYEHIAAWIALSLKLLAVTDYIGMEWNGIYINAIFYIVRIV